jgi:hypothetical protein
MLYTTGIGTHEPLVCLFVAIFGTGMVSTAAIVIVILIRAVAPTTRAQSSHSRCSDQVEDAVDTVILHGRVRVFQRKSGC